MSVIGYVIASDDRLFGQLLEWRPPRWVRVWMLWATRLGDGWVWLLTAALLAASGNRGLQVLAAGLVSSLLANTVLIVTKSRVHRARPCERAKPVSFDVDPLAWFPSDRFSFPSGMRSTRSQSARWSRSRSRRSRSRCSWPPRASRPRASCSGCTG
jgi:undecaprenyl-diphosphatase